MKCVFSIVLFVLTFNLWASCPAHKYNFKEKAATYSKVVLIPGAGSESDDLYLGYIRWGKYFSIYIDELEDRGIPYEVLKSSENGNESLNARANKLVSYLLNQKEKVLVIGHSLGGLVARIALRNPLAAKKVAATITIDTPNEGTPISDWILSGKALPKSAALLSLAFGFNLSEKEYLRELSVAGRGEWNSWRDHMPHIHNLYSVVSAQDPKEFLFANSLFMLGDQIIRDLTQVKGKRVSDGLVPVASQVWGKCILFVEKNHGSVLGKDIFGFATRDVLPQVLDNLSKAGIDFLNKL